ncbi:TPA: transcription-repair coupling factor [Mannheimia haemolytica]|uniref:Transcription-repair-coupling factor n=10 Tax=Mannheimia haemolytica TaxID=75985 RepID=A0A547EDK6_MANHA|nr:transcription-repair coupling factor [Mannheimia haemolytica]AWW72251.1 transcription-repair coupling factor [Pasteurellaceae bacterium 12565]AGI33548.1 transcription-repair coupling factor [Mannheimia haemolytica USDA-ARS-USMARC-183]AGI34538.1 transcription-repair coupling factor [Mannheimia haemolytica USDA-ARS-USMARC-185]AGK01536.1 transcription-repair coupling factor Mfd [Mannheimia haemolytica M42548]AGQ26359.1 transcription-repair coupling factor [Mannheimia haemolytica D153]
MSLISLNLPKSDGNFQDHQTLGNLVGHSDTLAISQAARAFYGLTVVVTPDTRTALRLEKALPQFAGLPVQLFPDWETLPYDNFSPHQDIISARLSALFELQQGRQQILLLPINTLMQKVCPPNYLANNVLLIKKGDRFSIQKLRLQLENAGYRAVEQVLEYGEYAVRGSILDLFPMGAEEPFRLDFFDDEIDSIRTFDVDNQRTKTEIAEINLLPAHEFPTDSNGIEHFRAKFREKFGEIRREPEHIYQQVSKGILNAGIEYWQPLFFEEMASLFDYFPAQTLFITFADIQQKAEQFHQDTQNRYESHRVDPMRPLLPPSDLWFAIDEVNRWLKGYPRLTITSEKIRKSAAKMNANVANLPDIAIQSSAKEPFSAFQQFRQKFDGNILFSVESEGRRETLLDLLAPLGVKPKQVNSLDEAQGLPFSLIISPLDQGFVVETGGHGTRPYDDELNTNGENDNNYVGAGPVPARNLAIICETDLLGERVQTRREKNRKAVNPDTLIRNLAELKIGQAVVHLENGVGRYGGLTVLDAGGIKAEYLVLHYANDAKLYVPVASLHLISRYIGGADETAPLHKLGSEAWAKTRQKAAEKIRDVAAELLDVYAKRESQTGFAFAYDKAEFDQFSATFPYEETDDQKIAINAVISDMCQAKAMDRLVCGDVGFGKTEVAIRATFLAVMNHKQVVILAPTTLLAQQHYENFKDRFANYPVNVEVLSRFKTAKEQKTILQNVAEGKVDILVGTHKLLQDDVAFRDLGLLVIDEEHRFGVRQKEKIKQLRANVDILTLTATPIPRTLNMALNGMRDLSIIASPPARRLLIKTFVRQSDEMVIREAILREILRGGQVYYLHNDVATIENCAEKLAELVPEARIVIGHGQMRERELERVMSDFYHQRFNLLVCSTIIETGIDVPTANTIIIERADKFGLAQLHQLRGRVGRSHHQAYAYMLTPHPKTLTKDAEQRLEAMSTIDNLGAGFALATHDLEIRGAGELLGSEQSGQIESIGFSLYMDLLENAVKALQEGREPSLDEITQHQAEIELRVPALLPDDYLPDVNMRLSFYKRIASSENLQSLNDLKVELIDRFGLLPEATKNLFAITQLRLSAQTLGIKKIDAGIHGGYLEFKPTAQPDPMKFIALIQKQPAVYSFEGAVKFKFRLALEDNRKRLEFVENLLREVVGG